jgi:hypothetical protein
MMFSLVSKGARLQCRVALTVSMQKQQIHGDERNAGRRDCRRYDRLLGADRP